VDVFGAGCERGVHYYAMRYIEGQTLAQLIDRKRKAPGGEAAGAPGYYRAAAEVAAQVAEALDYAHEHGVVHRDVKPSNVMLDTEGQAWVTDFGLAHLQRQAHLTQSGDLLGTLRYMSPEQALARRDLLDHRTDVYALGATLYELLTLRPAVRGDGREEVLHWLTFEEVVWPSRLSPAIPPDLEAIVLKAMARAPEERYATALELADDLRRFLNDQPVQARRPGGLRRAARWARRHPRPLLLAAFGTALLLALAVALLALSNVRVREALARSDLRAQEQRARAAEREETLQRATARWNEARVSLRARQPGQRYHSLEALAEVVRDLRSLGQLGARRADLRDDAIAALTLWDVRPVRRHSTVSSLSAPAVDPLGRHYAAAEASNVIAWRRLADDLVVRRWRWEGGRLVYLEVSPDGRYVLALGSDDRRPEKRACRVWDSETDRQVLHRPMADAGHAFRPDGQVLALARTDGRVALHDLGTGQDLPPLPAGRVPKRLRFHPSGKYLAVSSDAGPDVEVWDVAARKVALRLAGGRYGGSSLAWGPGGSLLAVGSTDTNLYVCTPSRGEVRAVLRGHELAVTGVEYHPSGRLLASTSHDDTTRLWCFSPGGELVLPGEKLLGFSPDGRRLTTWSRQGVTTEWEIEGPGDCLRYLPHGPGPRPGPWGVAFAPPDGRLLASASLDGVLLWDAAAGRRVGLVPSGWGYALAFSPDGRQLFTTGPGGWVRWPLEPERDGSAPRIGPGTVLRAPAAEGWSLRIDVAGTGESLLLGARDGGLDLVPRTEPGRVRRLGTHEGLIGVALSPDGRWAASAGGPRDAVRVWDVARGGLARRLPHAGEYCGVTFSPDGRWVVTGTRNDFCFWEVGSWEWKARLPRDPRSLFSSVAFTRDGRLLALVEGRNRIHLRDAITLERLATLETPGGASLSCLSLSPDGGRLAATTDANVTALWDLRRLRQELAALDLDWEIPTCPLMQGGEQAAGPLQVELVPAAKAPRYTLDEGEPACTTSHGEE
jgi:WD40 repeat protein